LLSVVACELQTKGRGRSNKQWFSNLGGSLTFSLHWNFKPGFIHLSGLSLTIALALIRVINNLTGYKFCIKWPNDILFNHQKIAGILVECKTNADKSISAIIGIGININAHPSMSSLISSSFTDLFKITGVYFDRNLLLASILKELDIILPEFESQGFSIFKDEWANHHCFDNNVVSLRFSQNKTFCGRIKGVTNNGELILSKDSILYYFSTGEVSLRLT